mmetsp:Transcript_85570/g.238891  ORF Transcript_85570/g.238891 Transcript_85570/m.238891 type:complete len:242 (-) Transcript_85570:505-1230(-)
MRVRRLLQELSAAARLEAGAASLHRLRRRSFARVLNKRPPPADRQSPLAALPRRGFGPRRARLGAGHGLLRRRVRFGRGGAEGREGALASARGQDCERASRSTAAGGGTVAGQALHLADWHALQRLQRCGHHGGAAILRHPRGHGVLRGCLRAFQDFDPEGATVTQCTAAAHQRPRVRDICQRLCGKRCGCVEVATGFGREHIQLRCVQLSPWETLAPSQTSLPDLRSLRMLGVLAEFHPA